MRLEVHVEQFITILNCFNFWGCSTGVDSITNSMNLGWITKFGEIKKKAHKTTGLVSSP